ncbi:MAG: DUF308 domain-containing protein [Alphaproteobacteria bacterium]|nr:DUF308 domain-containing protein [Alphaproteobacteria bacterium]
MQQDKRCSIWHLIAGIIMLVLGIVVWANPAQSLLGIALYFGLIIFLLGCGYITFSLQQYSGWYMVIGLFDVFMGLIFMTNLGLTVDTLPIFFALWILASGVIQITGSWEIRKLGMPWGWSMLSGLIGVFLAYYILHSEQFGEWALVLTAGTYLVVYGIISIAEYFYFRHYCRLAQTA